MRAGIVAILLFLPSVTAGQTDYDLTGTVYFGVGTSVSSYWGGYFGDAYAMRVFAEDSYYYDDYYYNYGYDDYYDYTIWSPLQFDINAGYYITENIVLESEVSFLFHYNGRVDPEFFTSTQGERNYQDRNDYAQLYAVPVSIVMKWMITGDPYDDAYLKFGPAFQYTSEKYDRVREYYSYSGYNEYSYDVYLGTVEKSRWLSGFRAGLGISYSLGDYMSGFTELEYSYFGISPDYSTALALDRAKEAQLYSLKTSIVFGF